VSLHFPDASAELPLAAGAELLTNRRFVELGYWLELARGGRVAFSPRGYVLPAPPGATAVELGGPLTARAAAAILVNENLGRPDDKQLWTDVVLEDAGGHAVDAAASDIGWQVATERRDGKPLPAAPLTAAAIDELGDLGETLRFAVRYRLRGPVALEVRPEPFAELARQRVSTSVPAHMTWRSQAYLAKVERSLRLLGEVRGRPVEPDYRVALGWWMNDGAVGGHGSFTMPIQGMAQEYSWYSHPWALTHELLHGLGYGHNEDMDRVDRLVQERFEHWRWHAADHPELVPPEVEPSAR
jgi:hypothetical protein